MNTREALEWLRQTGFDEMESYLLLDLRRMYVAEQAKVTWDVLVATL